MADPLQPAGVLTILAGDPNARTLTPFALTPDSRSALVISGSQTGNTFYGNTINRYDLATGSVVQSWRVGTQLTAADVSADGRYIVATEGQTGQATVVNGSYVVPVYVHRVDTVTGDITTFQQFVPASGPATLAFYDVAVLGDGTALLGRAGSSGAATLGLARLDIAMGMFLPVGDLPNGGAIAGNLVASTDHSRVLIGAVNSPSFFEATATGQSFGFTGDASYTNTGVQAISSSGRYSVGQTTNGALYVHDARLNPAINLALLHPELYATGDVYGPVAGARGAAFSPDEASLYIFEKGTNEVFVLSTADWSIRSIIPLAPSFFPLEGSLLVSADGRYLTVGQLTVDLSRAFRIDPGADNVLSTDQTGGTILYGYAGNDTLSTVSGTLYGGDGNDVLTGSSYQATLVGGAGDDTFYAEGQLFGFRGPYYFVFPTVSENAGGGTDVQYSRVGRLGDNVETLIGTSTDQNILIGNVQANTIIGNSGTDYIMPGAGSDTIDFRGGRAVLAGSETDLGSDRVSGFTFGSSVIVTSFTTFESRYSLPGGTQATDFFYSRSGESLSLYGAAPVGLVGLVGGRFVQTLTNEAATFQFGSPQGFGTNVTLTLRPNSANLNDFNGDGHADILWRNADGRISTWQVTGNGAPAISFPAQSTLAPSVQQNAYNTVTPAGWTLQGTADFAGDGGSDLLWRNDASGNLAIWAGTGQGGFTPGGYVSGAVAGGWNVTSLGDFTGDGRDDVLWRNDNGSVDVWRSVAGGGFVAQPVIGVDASWHVQGTADFNGDGRADILWRNANGAVSLWSGSDAAGGFTVTYDRAAFDRSWHVAGTGDITGDGRADVLWRNDDGRVMYWASTATGGFDEAAYVPVQVDVSWKVAGLFDFNDDGRDDVLWRNDDGRVSIWLSNGNTLQMGLYDGFAPAGWSIVNSVHDIV